jgi:hypothetical protein
VSPFTQEFYDGLTREEKLEVARMRLEHDDQFYSERCLQIVDQNAELRPLVLKQAQKRLIRAKWMQERAGRPVRIIVLKARKEGISTIVQGLLLKRCTQRANHRAQVIAHDKETGEGIFEMAETMYSNLPNEQLAGLLLKPPTVRASAGQEIVWGQPSRSRRFAGDRGLNSSYKVDTANNYESGRGLTPFTLHCSEFAFWENAEKKSKALFNSIPDTPATMIVIESTANGYNLFRKLWIAAETGQSAYYPLFIAWYEDPQYWMPFAHAEERDEFIADIGRGPFGEAEPELVALGVQPEQLRWRRWAIVNKANGDLRAFWQEYPATAQEAFLATGKQVFASVLVSQVLERTESTEAEAEEGIIKPQKLVKSKYMGREIEVPAEPLWLPATAAQGVGTPLWRRWAKPDLGEQSADPEKVRPPGQYVIELDSASGVETASEGTDYFAIQVIDHRTLEQVAVWHAREIDPNLATEQLYLAALLYTIPVLYPDGSKRLWRPWVAIETTGGFGQSAATTLWKMWRYPNLYFRSPADRKSEKQEDRLGWSTDHVTKPLLVDWAQQLLRLGRTGLRHHATAAEMQTYVRDPKSGKMGAEEDYFDDLLESWMIAQYVAREKPLRRLPRPEAVAGAGRKPKVAAPTLNVKPRTFRYQPR